MDFKDRFRNKIQYIPKQGLLPLLNKKVTIQKLNLNQPKPQQQQQPKKASNRDYNYNSQYQIKFPQNNLNKYFKYNLIKYQEGLYKKVQGMSIYNPFNRKRQFVNEIQKNPQCIYLNKGLKTFEDFRIGNKDFFQTKQNFKRTLQEQNSKYSKNQKLKNTQNYSQNQSNQSSIRQTKNKFLLISRQMKQKEDHERSMFQKFQQFKRLKKIEKMQFNKIYK